MQMLEYHSAFLGHFSMFFKLRPKPFKRNLLTLIDPIVFSTLLSFLSYDLAFPAPLFPMLLPIILAVQKAHLNPYGDTFDNNLWLIYRISSNG